MTKSRIEVNENGDFFLLIPNDVVEDCGYDEGDLVEWDASDPEIVMITPA